MQSFPRCVDDQWQAQRCVYVRGRFDLFGWAPHTHTHTAVPATGHTHTLRCCLYLVTNPPFCLEVHTNIDCIANPSRPTGGILSHRSGWILGSMCPSRSLSQLFPLALKWMSITTKQSPFNMWQEVDHVSPGPGKDGVNNAGRGGVRVKPKPLSSVDYRVKDHHHPAGGWPQSVWDGRPWAQHWVALLWGCCCCLVGQVRSMRNTVFWYTTYNTLVG